MNPNPQTQQSILEQLLHTLNAQPAQPQPASSSENLIASMLIAFGLGFAIGLFLMDIVITLRGR